VGRPNLTGGDDGPGVVRRSDRCDTGDCAKQHATDGGYDSAVVKGLEIAKALLADEAARLSAGNRQIGEMTVFGIRKSTSARSKRV